MFIDSQELNKLIKDISEKIMLVTNNKVIFEEYIALPYYGNIILRFNINDKDYKIDDIDKYENIINELVNKDFLIDFMGNVYKKVGVDYSKLDSILEKFNLLYNEEEIVYSKYHSLIAKDAEELLIKCGLNPKLDVWEIQYEDEVNIFLLGNAYKEIKTLKLDKVYNVFEIDKNKCEGLLKATLFARKNNMSLGRLMLECK